MNRLIAQLCVIPALLVSSLVMGAAGGGEHIVPAPINIHDKISLQKGAQIYVNNCLGCHDARFMRYGRVAEDLGISEELMLENLIFTGAQIGEPMINSMPDDLAKKWFGVTPPDLSLEARLRGPDWLYSYLISFYEDDSRPYGYNNKVFADVGMPHVLQSMEAELGEEAFKEAMADLTNFMVYMAEPIRSYRESIAKYVLLFLAVLAIPIYFLNKEYAKDYH